ncbi:hypothetical protein EIP86_007533 [Pleurotus ostreatoroseus]|nr:hypothetical protein EIP86_007533 [Pleurotus ostreatoroseus]
MATTRSSKLRRRTNKGNGKGRGKRAARPKQVTYRGLLHAALANLCRRTKYGPKPIPQEDCTAEMLRLATVVGKPLPRADWYRRYAARHVHAAVADGFLQEHDGGALSVTPTARIRYRAARRAAHANLPSPSSDVVTTALCLDLDHDVGPTAHKSRAELIAENNVLSARLNAEYPSPVSESASASVSGALRGQGKALQAWNSLSTAWSGDADAGRDVDVEESASQYGGADSASERGEEFPDSDTVLPDSDDLEPAYVYENECEDGCGSESPMAVPVAGPSTLQSPIKLRPQISYPSPQSLPRTRSWHDRRALPEPATPTPPARTLSASLVQQQLETPVTPGRAATSTGTQHTICYTATQTQTDAEGDMEDVVMLDVPGASSVVFKARPESLPAPAQPGADAHTPRLPPQVSAVALKQRIRALEQDAEAQVALVASLTQERDEHAQLAARLQTGAEADAQTIAALNERVAGCDAKIASLQKELADLQREYEACQIALADTTAELHSCRVERDDLEEKIRDLQSAIDAARGDQANELKELKEDHEVTLQLVRAQMEELKEDKRKAEEKVGKIMKLCME